MPKGRLCDWFDRIVDPVTCSEPVETLSAPTLVQENSTWGTGISSLSLPGAPTAGNLGIIYFYTYNTGTGGPPDTPSGWTRIANIDFGSFKFNFRQMAVYTRTYVGGDSASVPITLASIPTSGYFHLSEWSGAGGVGDIDFGSVIDFEPGFAGASITRDIATTTPGTPVAILGYGLSLDNDTPSVTNITWTVLTEIGEEDANSGRAGHARLTASSAAASYSVNISGSGAHSVGQAATTGLILVELVGAADTGSDDGLPMEIWEDGPQSSMWKWLSDCTAGSFGVDIDGAYYTADGGSTGIASVGEAQSVVVDTPARFYYRCKAGASGAVLDLWLASQADLDMQGDGGTAPALHTKLLFGSGYRFYDSLQAVTTTFTDFVPLDGHLYWVSLDFAPGDHVSIRIWEGEWEDEPEDALMSLDREDDEYYIPDSIDDIKLVMDPGSSETLWVSQVGVEQYCPPDEGVGTETKAPVPDPDGTAHACNAITVDGTRSGGASTTMPVRPNTTYTWRVTQSQHEECAFTSSLIIRTSAADVRYVELSPATDISQCTALACPALNISGTFTTGASADPFGVFTFSAVTNGYSAPCSPPFGDDCWDLEIWEGIVDLESTIIFDEDVFDSDIFS